MSIEQEPNVVPSRKVFYGASSGDVATEEPPEKALSVSTDGRAASYRLGAWGINPSSWCRL